MGRDDGDDRKRDGVEGIVAASADGDVNDFYSA